MGLSAGTTRGTDLSARSPVLRLILFLVLGGIWAAAAWSLWDSAVPNDLSLPDVRIEGISQEILARADRYERFFRIEFVVSQLVLIGVLLLYAKHGVRFAKESAAGQDRHGDAARDARACVRLALAGAVPARRGLVGPPLRPDRQRLPRDALHELVRARRRVPVHQLRTRRGDGARGGVPAPLVARSSTVLHRARNSLQLHLSVPDSDRAAPPQRPGRCRPRVRGEAGNRPGPARGSRTSRTSPAPRTRTRPASGRRSGSSSGTRSSTAASPTTR